MAYQSSFTGPEIDELLRKIKELNTTGRSIASIERTDGDGSPGTTDTYTITYTDETTDTFTVYNGADGKTVRCIVKIEPDIMDPWYWVEYSDGTTERIDFPTLPEHFHSADDIDGGEFRAITRAGEGVQYPDMYVLRNIKVGLTAEDPENEGEIFFKCK